MGKLEPSSVSYSSGKKLGKIWYHIIPGLIVAGLTGHLLSLRPTRIARFAGGHRGQLTCPLLWGWCGGIRCLNRNSQLLTPPRKYQNIAFRGISCHLKHISG